MELSAVCCQTDPGPSVPWPPIVSTTIVSIKTSAVIQTVRSRLNNGYVILHGQIVWTENGFYSQVGDQGNFKLARTFVMTRAATPIVVKILSIYV